MTKHLNKRNNNKCRVEEVEEGRRRTKQEIKTRKMTKTG